MIEALSISKINSQEYRQIISEFDEMWKKFKEHRYEIDIILGNSRFFVELKAFFRKIFELNFLSIRSKNEILWKLLYLFYGMKSKKFTSEILLRSNRLWAIKYWEYPWVISNIGLTKPMKILDIGSGWSLLPMYLARHGHQIEAIDTNEDQMARISPFLARIQGAGVKYRIQNVSNMDYEDETFDRVSCISVLEHIEEKEVNGKCVNYHTHNLDVKAISEMMRVLKKGGMLLMTIDWSENPAEKRAYKLKDVYSRLLSSYRNLLLNDEEPKIKWDEYRLEIMKLWKEKFPFRERDTSSIGIILKKR